jgi:hypothetical protein
MPTTLMRERAKGGLTVHVFAVTVCVIAVVYLLFLLIKGDDF